MLTTPPRDQLVELVLPVATILDNAGLDVLPPAKGGNVLSKDATTVPSNFKLKLLLSL